jgi:hypothetical protein
MRNFSRLLCVFGLAMALGSFTWIEETSAIPIEARPQISWNDIIKRLLGDRKPKDRRSGGYGGSRPIGGECLISPSQNQTIWSDRPLLVWKGGNRTVGVALDGEEPLLFRQTVAFGDSGLRRVNYTGTTLQSGKTYKWLFFADEASNELIFWVKFQMMDKSSRDSITVDLQALESKLKSQGASQELLALQRANYFSQRQLWTDVLQEVYSVENPSAELEQVAQEILAQFCGAVLPQRK